MVHRIAQHVHERLHEHLDDRLVRLGILALDHQRRGLAELRGELVYQAWKSLERDAQRQHSHADDGSLQLADEAVEAGVLVLERHGERGAFALCELDGVADRVLRYRELAGQPHERIDSVGIHAQRLRASRRGGGPARARLRVPPASPRATALMACTRRCGAGFRNGRGRFGGHDVGLRRPAEMAQHIRGDDAGRGDTCPTGGDSPAAASNCS